MVLDVVGLEISVPEFIWTVINFFVLLFLLKRFLYDPVLKFMNERSARIEAGLSEGKRAEKALAENEQALAQELALSGNAARALIGDARSDAEKEKAKLLGGAHAEAEALHKQIRERISTEEAQTRAELDAELPELVGLLTEQLLGEGAADGEAISRRMRESDK